MISTVVLLTANCGSATADDKASVRIGVLRSSLNTVIHSVALQEGYYARNGLEPVVTPFTSGNGTAGSESLMRNTLDVYIGTPVELARVDSAAIVAGKKPPLISVALGSPAMTNLVLRKEIPFSKLQDLKGLRIGVSSPGSDHLVIFRYYLNQAGLSTEALGLQMLAVGGSNMPAALKSKQIDGFLHSEPTTSIAMTKADGKRVVGGTDLGVAGQAPNLSVVLSRDWALAHREIVQRVVRALTEASAEYPKISKEKMLTIFQAYIHSDSDVLALAYEHIDPRIHDMKTMADAYWKVNIPAMVKRGEITDKLQAADLFDMSFGGE
jgi:NitT/TauT family transport system substrate-binding protein